MLFTIMVLKTERNTHDAMEKLALGRHRGRNGGFFLRFFLIFCIKIRYF
jgi:hypothetical protein